MKIYYIIITLFIVIISCDSNDDTTEPINPPPIPPTVSTQDAIILSDGSVSISALKQANDNVITHQGFEYSTDSLISQNKTTINLDVTNENEFSYLINSGIQENIDYYFKAFIKSNNITYYGEINDFIIESYEEILAIDSLSNNYGHIADTLLIYGKNFINTTNSTEVDFSDINSTIISISDTLISCIVPININSINPDIRVKIGMTEDINSSFQLFAPTITSLIPIEAVLRDTITIKGTHFDIVNYRNKVFFGNIEVSPIISTRDSLRVIVPLNIGSPIELIKIEAQLQEDTFEEEFRLSTPIINNISPLIATFRDELTITGDNFGGNINENKVFFGTVEATIIEADRNTIIVKVPDDLENSTETISIQAQLQEVIYNENFVLIPPQINFVEEMVYSGQEIDIQGAYFHPIASNNIITIEDIVVESSANTTENFITNIPDGPFPRRKAIVRVQILDLIEEYEIELTILDDWIMITENLPFKYTRFFNNAMVANNTAYVIAPVANNGAPFYLWKFNPEDLSWEQSSLPFTVENTGTATSNGNNLYVYTAETDKGFWEYNTSNNQWTQKTAFLGARRDWPTHFSLNNEIYIGLGGNFDNNPSTPFSDFFKYNPNNNTWVEIAEFEYQNTSVRTETSTFVINNIAYFGNGARSTGVIDFWSYHPNTDEWIRVADYPYAMHYTAGFSLNGFGYVTGGSPVGGSTYRECWRFNPASNIWEQTEDIGRLRSGHFSFSINGKAYIGGGFINNSGSLVGYDMYEFIPE